VIRYTAASSLVSKPTRRFGSWTGQIPLSTSDRSAGPIFAAQPQVRDIPVRVFFRKRSIVPFPVNHVVLMTADETQQENCYISSLKSMTVAKSGL
jgi:hypothetical protein